MRRKDQPPRETTRGAESLRAPHEDAALAERHAWLLIGAEQKAASIIALTHGFRVRTILDVGSGTGAVLEVLDREGFGESYYALEPSVEQHRFMQERVRISRLVAAEASTLRRSTLARQRYDLVVISHVLEHIEDPARLLADTLDVGDLVLAEVPLEGSLLGTARAGIRRLLTGIPRFNNTAGHVQFLSCADVRRLVRWCGGEIIAERVYVPRAQIRHIGATGALARRVHSAAVLVGSRIVGDRLWGRFYYGHMAVLMRRRPPIPLGHRTRWPSDAYCAAPDTSGNEGPIPW